jgi:hypothetical protein
MIIFFAHLAMALMLFLLTNWIGRHSIQVGYMEISVIAKSNESPAFNFIYRAFSPIAFILLASSVLFSIGFSYLAKDIYLVVFYYFSIRILFNVLVGRFGLLGKAEFFLIAATSCAGAFFVHQELISTKSFFFPTRQEIGTALWLGVAAFLYKTINSIEFSSSAARRRVEKYVFIKRAEFSSLYRKVFSEECRDRGEKNLVLAILIYEDFNRPRAYRFLERLIFPRFKRKASIGPMQVTTEDNIGDLDSVIIGARKIVEAYRRATAAALENDESPGWAARAEAIASYNSGYSYREEVENIFCILDSEGDR